MLPRLGPSLLLFSLWACESTQVPPNDEPNAPPVIKDVSVTADEGVQDASPEDAGAWDAWVPGDAAEPDGAFPDATVFPQVPFAIETRVGNVRTPVGLENRVTCEVLDQQGAPIPGLSTQVEVQPDSGFERTEIGMVGQLARAYRLICVAPTLGLRDPTPADWTVEPGPVALVTTEVSVDELPSGGLTTVSCAAYDDYGNEVSAAHYDLHFDPPLGDAERQDILDQPPSESTWRIYSAGRFDVTCGLPDAESAPGIRVEVKPGPPASISLALSPDLPVYRVGQVVELIPVVTDRYDNPRPELPVQFHSEPALPTFGAARFRLNQEGTFRLSANLSEGTEDGQPLMAEKDILVDFGGPGIECEWPTPGEAIDIPDGQMGELHGKVADITGIDRILIDGVGVGFDAEGRFVASVPVEFGLNVHEVVAIDDNGNENATFCAYIAANDFLDEDAFLSDALVLRLGQGALDNGEPDAPIASVADILRRVLNSQGLRDTVHQAALAQNPIVPNECRAQVLGVCLFRLGVEYQNIRIGGRNELTLTVVDGGLRARSTIRDIELTAKLQGTLGNTARIQAEYVTVDLTFAISLRFDGKPDVRLSAVNEISVGNLNSDFSGFITGAILDLVFNAFEGLIRRTVVDAIKGFIQDNFDRVLSDLFGSVTVGEFAQGVDVPSLTGGEGVRLVMTAGLSRLDFGQGRALVGVKSKIDGPIRLAGHSLGVPLPPGTNLVEPPADRTVGGVVQLGVINQLMHRLWRSGYFEAEGSGLVNTVAQELPENIQVSLRFPTPPIVSGVAGSATVRVFVGPLSAEVQDGLFFVTPFRVRLAAVVDATVRLEGERDLRFEGLEVRALHLALGGAALEVRAREVLEDTLRRVIQGIVDQALNNGLPVLPLPEFVLPESLRPFDLPVGSGLGLRQPALTGTSAQWILTGNFGQ